MKVRKPGYGVYVMYMTYSKNHFLWYGMLKQTNMSLYFWKCFSKTNSSFPKSHFTSFLHTGYPKINPTTDSDLGQVTQPVSVSIFPFSKTRETPTTTPTFTAGIWATQRRQNYMNAEQNCKMFSKCDVWLLSQAVQGFILWNWDFPLTFVGLCFAHLSRQTFALRSWAKDTVVLQITVI